MTKDTQDKLDRRGFLRAGAAGSAAAAVAVLPQAVEAQTTTRETRQQRDRARYQPNSKHVQDFYRTNRY